MLLKKLENENKYTVIRWILVHCGMPGNERGKDAMKLLFPVQKNEALIILLKEGVTHRDPGRMEATLEIGEHRKAAL